MNEIVDGFQMKLTISAYPQDLSKVAFDGICGLFMQYHDYSDGRELVGIAPSFDLGWADYSDMDHAVGSLDFSAEEYRMEIVSGPKDKLEEIRNWRRPERRRNGKLK